MIDLVLIGLTRFLVGGHSRWIGSQPHEPEILSMSQTPISSDVLSGERCSSTSACEAKNGEMNE